MPEREIAPSRAFPEPIALGATFDVPLVHEMALAISVEARAEYNQKLAAHREGLGLEF